MIITPSNFVKQVVSAYNSSKGVFANKVNAEDLIPEGIDDKTKSLYLFYVIQLDYATKSQNLYKGAKLLFKGMPKFFQPESILRLSDVDLEDLLKKYLRPRYINEAVLRYKSNSHKLIKDFSSDPRNIFVSSLSAKDALKAVSNFRGFGPKIGNFFARTMINVFNYSYADIEDILPPVDVHDVKIAYLLGYIDMPDMTTKNINLVKVLWSDACKEADVSWLVFDKALWLLGSEGLPKTREDVMRFLQ